MKEFKLSSKNEERLFSEANQILDQRRERSAEKAYKRQRLNVFLSQFKLSVDLKVAPLLIPVTAALIILLLSAPSIEYDGNFIDIGTTVLDSESAQGE